MIEKLEDALVSAFPPVAIDRAMIDESTALWHVYDDYGDLSAFEGKTWRELPAELLVKHSTLPIYAGDSLWRATLPGYLWHLLHERERFNDAIPGCGPAHAQGRSRVPSEVRSPDRSVFSSTTRSNSRRAHAPRDRVSEWKSRCRSHSQPGTL